MKFDDPQLDEFVQDFEKSTNRLRKVGEWVLVIIFITITIITIAQVPT